MNRTLPTLAAAALVSAAAIFAAPPSADAATRCRGHSTDVTRGDYVVAYGRYRALDPHEASEVTRKMNCSSVRYAMRAVRRKVRKQRGYPHVPTMFWDGYVTWDCYRAGGTAVACVEYDSNTGFKFRARVY